MLFRSETLQDAPRDYTALRDLSLSGRFVISPWALDFLGSNTAVLNNPSLSLGSPPFILTTSQILSLLASNPNIRNLALLNGHSKRTHYVCILSSSHYGGGLPLARKKVTEKMRIKKNRTDLLECRREGKLNVNRGGNHDHDLYACRSGILGVD